MVKPDNGKVITVDWLNKLEILVIDKKKDFNFFIKEHGLEDDPIADDWDLANGSMAALTRDGLSFFVMIFPTKAHRVIVHECVHMAQAIMERKGIELCAETGEVLAYMTDHLYTEVVKLIR